MKEKKKKSKRKHSFGELVNSKSVKADIGRADSLCIPSTRHLMCREVAVADLLLAQCSTAAFYHPLHKMLLAA